MVDEIRTMTDGALLVQFASAVRTIESLIELKNITNTEDIPTFSKDSLSLHLIEVLRRMGQTPEEIKESLKKFPLLQYKNGEENFFDIDKIAN